MSLETDDNRNNADEGQPSPGGDIERVDDDVAGGAVGDVPENSGRGRVKNFFFPANGSQSPAAGVEGSDDGIEELTPTLEERDRSWVDSFWTTYDDIIIISLFTQLGIVFRLGAATWFSFFDSVFSSESALFVNLPLNCFSCFLMGALSPGENLMQIIETRFTPKRTQQEIMKGDGDDSMPHVVDCDDNHAGQHTRRRRRRRRKKQKESRGWEPPIHLHDEQREVQLFALERRIRASPGLLLFALKKEDEDVMEHYFTEGYRRNSQGVMEYAPEENPTDGDAQQGQSLSNQRGLVPANQAALTPSGVVDGEDGMASVSLETPNGGTPTQPAADGEEQGGEKPSDAHGRSADQIFHDVSHGVSENLTRLRRVNLADGWDRGTSAEAMSEDLMLGLRDGFCGAVSSFSSWNSSMVNLLRNGKIVDTIVGYVLGIQLPIVAYRFGQHVAVYVFIWRWRRETREDEERGYGIQISIHDNSDRDQALALRSKYDRELMSVRAFFTALFVLALMTQFTMLFFYQDPDHQQIALSLLFSPLGALTRWRLSRWNRKRPSFPLGTFTSNVLACALSGGVGKLLAGNPGPRERIFLVSLIAGFAGTLSSVAAFIVEILAGVDPLLFKFDGITYGMASVFWAFLVGLVFAADVDWADDTSG